MTDKKDGPGQDQGPAKAGDRAQTEAGGKRPFATIDLKAVDVTGAAQKSASSQQTVPKAPPAAQPRGEADAARKIAAAAAAVGAARGGAPNSGAAAARPGKVDATPASPPGASVPGVDVPRPRLAPVGRGFGSQILAGLVGAALALVAGPYLTSTITPLLQAIGLPPPKLSVPAEVASRLTAVETRLAQPPLPPGPERDPARANAAAEANRKQIEALQKSLASLGETQSRTAHVADELQSRLAKEPAIADVASRLLAMENQLNELGAAARSEPDRAGRIPQLVQITGRIADLETSLTTRLAELRKDLAREIDTRLAPVSDASEAARTTVQRLDREVGAVKGETNRIATSLDQVKTGTERLQLALKAAQDESAKLAASIDAARRDADTRLGAAAKPADVTAAVAPLASQLAALERSLTTVVKSESERNATAERIVLSLELGNLKRAMERGAPYSRELAEVAKVSGQRLELAPLERYRNEGVPTLAELARGFRPVAHAVLDADAEKADGGVVERLLSGARTFVRVRKTTHPSGDQSPEAVIARIEDALRGGRLGEVLAEAKSIENKPDVARDWISKVEARQAVDAAVKSIDESLKAALGATPASSPTPGTAAPAAQKKGQP